MQTDFELGLPPDSPLLLSTGGAPEAVMLDSMEALDEADENAMEMSQQPSLCREDRSRTDCRAELKEKRRSQQQLRQQQQKQQQQHARSPHSQATVPIPVIIPVVIPGNAEPSAGEGKETATQGGGAAAKACDGASAGGDVASAGVDDSAEKERRNPVKNLQPEFLSAILESDDQLDYHTDALLGYYDADCDKRLMIADLKDFLPTFYVQLGCDQPESLELLDLFASSDLDRDGSLDRDEFKGFLRALLKQGQEVYELSQL